MFSGWKKPYRDYDVGDQIGFGGTFGLWQIYTAVNRKTEQTVSIWLIEKKPIEKQWFKKDPNGFKKFCEYLKLEARALGNLNCGLIIYENMNDDGSYLSFCSEAVVGTLMSLHYQLGDFSIAKVNERQQTGTYSQQQLNLLQYIEPDVILYGISTIVSDLTELHKNNVVHGNLSPANIAVTLSGEWRLCGFMFTQNQTFQFQFGGDAAHYLHPAAAFMTPKMIAGKYANFGTDSCQLFLSIYACAGNRAPIINFGKDTIKRDKWPTQDQLVSQIAEKICGNAAYTSQFHIEPAQAQKLAQQNTEFWSAVCQNSSFMQQYPPLQFFSSIQNVILQALQETQRGIDLQSGLNNGNTVGQLSQYILQVNQLGGFNGKYGPENKYQFQQLFQLIQNNYDSLSVDFIVLVLLQRLVKLLQHRQLHSDVVQLLIKLNEKLYIPRPQLFQLFEPIVMSVTYSKCRQYFQGKTIPFQAWSGVSLQVYGDVSPNANKYKPITLKYISPYNDMALEGKFRERDRDKYIPIFDKELDEQIPNSYHQTASVISTNLNFFWHPQALSRSHFYTLNFITGCFQSTSEITLRCGITGLENSAGLLSDPRWMKDETGNTSTVTLGSGLDYSKPLSMVLAPHLTGLLKMTKNATQLEKTFAALAIVTPHLTDQQISGVLLPAVNGALDNVQQHAKAICGFALFCRRTKTRCTGKTVAVMYLPRLLRMAYQDATVAQPVMEACDELFAYVRADLNGNTHYEQLQTQLILEDQAVETHENNQEFNQMAIPAPPNDYSQQQYDNQQYNYQYDYNYGYEVAGQGVYSGAEQGSYAQGGDYGQQYGQDYGQAVDTGDPMDW